MKNIFAGLESLGLKGTDKVDVFEEKTEIETVVQLKNRDLPFKMNKKVKIFN